VKSASCPARGIGAGGADPRDFYNGDTKVKAFLLET